MRPTARSPRRVRVVWTLAVCALLLGACQSGGGDDGEPGDDVAASADIVTPADVAAPADAATPTDFEVTPDSGCLATGCDDAAADDCPSDPDKTAPGVCGCGVADLDSDDDGMADCLDGCADDPDKTEPGACGCGAADTDGDDDGTPDCLDGCGDDPDKTEPGDCGCGTADTDGDDDGTPDCLDGCVDDPDKTEPGACDCGTADTDGDDDGTPDCLDDCPGDPDKTEPGVCDCGAADVDGDDDGVLDCLDGCPSDGAKTEPGFCDCGTADTDGDDDGTPDCLDGCATDPAKTEPGACGCGAVDTDRDEDGTADCVDGCPDDPGKSASGACGCGTADTDTDDDGTADCLDACPRDPHKTEPGSCGCGYPDVDTDEDGTVDCLDPCPHDPDKVEAGACGCGTPETDRDEDGRPDCIDDCPDDPAKPEPGVCGCGSADVDSDEDGTADCFDPCPADPDKVEPGACGCGTADTDTDEDGTPDCNDPCSGDAGKIEAGVCGCGTPDTDRDEDGTADCIDPCPDDPDKTAPGLCGCGTADTDTDEDDTPDCHDDCDDDPFKTTPGLCGCGTADTDTDEDDTPDCHDDCDEDPDKIVAGLCGCGVADTDTDGDDLPDCHDDCDEDPDKIVAGLCGCGVADTDTDGDDTPDCHDDCDEDPDKIVAGLCGCGVADTDTDEDDTPDCHDDCDDDPDKIVAGLCGCGVADTDTDEDDTPDCHDDCDEDPGKTAPGDCGCGTVDTPNCDEIDPPSPLTMEWAIAPQALGTNAIAMAAVVATDPSGVEYYFLCLEDPDHDSGWQDDPAWVDTGLAPDIQYTYRVKARDKSLNYNETDWSEERSATTAGEPGYASGLQAQFFDFTVSLPVIPDLSTMTPVVERIDRQIAYESTLEPWEGLDARFTDRFASRHTGFLRIEVAGDYTLSLASDNFSKLWLNGELVLTNGGSPSMTEVSAVRSLAAGYHPIRLDFLENDGPSGLILSYESAAMARQVVPRTALYRVSTPDTAPPTPDPTTWAVAPAPTGARTISMTAAAASDQSGVQYYFECTAGTGHSSGWQYARTYEDAGLEPGASYTYRVRARDLSTSGNATGWSVPASGTTHTWVPYIVNLPHADAEAAIAAAALVVGDVTFDNSDTIPAGNVVSQSPSGDDLVPGGSAVDLVVSLGPVMVDVPDVVAEAEASAASAIEAAGLVVGSITVAESCLIPVGHVISQDPVAGASAPRGTRVDLVVAVGPERLVISEIMYHPDFEAPGEEFLEIHNPCAYTVNLENWGVLGLAGFVFPAGASIGPDGYVVLTDDADGFVAAYGFPADFVYSGNGLANGGEALTLLAPGGVVVDEVTYDDDGSWPVTPDGLGPSLELIDPSEDNDTPRNWHASIAGSGHTAGARNSVDATGLPPWISGVLHAPVEPGTPMTVTAVVEDAATVELTYVIDFGPQAHVAMLDDGASGDGAAGDGVYGATIAGQPVGTLIRYRIDAVGPTGTMGFPRDDDTVTYTGTYLEDPTVVSDLPIVHWLMDPADYAAALAHYRTDEVEPALVFHAGVLYDGVLVRVRGHSSRGWPKKHWKFKFPQGHDFYDVRLSPFPLDEFNLQSSYADKSYVREILSYETFTEAGCPSLSAAPVRIQQNGAFYGLYTFVESKDGSYLERHGQPEDGAYYKGFAQCEYLALSTLPSRYEKKNPEDADYTDLFQLLTGINTLSGQARRDFVFDNVDIPGMLSYLAGTCIVHNNDHVAKNYYLFRDTSGTQRWVMHPWDMDLTFGRTFQGAVLNDVIFADDDDVGRTNVSPGHPLFGDSEHQKWDHLWNRLIDVLLEEPDIRQMYYRRLRTLMDELLVEGRYEVRIDELAALVWDEAELDRQRWGWYGVSETQGEAVARLKAEYLDVRRIHLGVTHRVDGEIPEAQSPDPVVVINEIMYNPADDPAGPTGNGNTKEFVELYNPSLTEAVDLTGWRLLGTGLTIPSGAVILPNSYLLVVSNDVTFRATYGSGHFVAGEYGAPLEGGGKQLRLVDRAGAIVDEVTYQSIPPWPTEPDAGLVSLELIDPSADNRLPENWAASELAGGTPGAENSVTWMAP